RQCAERAHPPAVETTPQHSREDREDGEQVPGEVVAGNWQVPVDEREHVHDRDELALCEPQIDNRHAKRHIFPSNTLPKETDKSQRSERGEPREVNTLRAHDLAPRGCLLVLVGELPAGTCRRLLSNERDADGPANRLRYGSGPADHLRKGYGGPP